MNRDIKQKIINVLCEIGFDPDKSAVLADDLIEIDRRAGGILKLALRVETAFDKATAQALARGIRELNASEAYLTGVIMTIVWRNGRPPAEVRFP